jgi:TP901 family phage tail tape measure protein
MGVATMRVPTVFTAIDRFSGVVSKMTATTAAFGRTAEAAAMRTSRRFNSAGTTMLYAGAAIATGLGYAINEAMKYESAVASLAAVTGTEVGSMNKQIESLGNETKRSVIDIAKSFEIVGSKMSQYLGDPEALKQITKSSILMADASKMELEPAIESLTGVLNIFGKSAKDANYIVNKLSAGEIVGSVSIAQTADILRQFGGTARLANVEVDESIALIQTLTKSLGVEGVGRGIRNLMTDLNMVGAFDKNKTKALEKAGVNMDVLGNKSLDLVTRLKELKKLEGKGAAMGMFFKKTGIQTGATLFQNFDDYIRFLDAIQKTNKAQEQAAKNNATVAKRMRDLKAQVSLLAIKIGTHLIPVVNDLVSYLGPIINDIIDWVKENKTLIKTLAKATLFLLALGVAAKIGAALFLGYARALAIIEFATKAYTGTLWFLSLGLEGAATAATYAAASLWAILWPLGLLAASVWIIIDMVQHWEDWNEIVLLMLGPLGQVGLLLSKIYTHSSNIKNQFAFEGWGGGISAIGTMLEDLILSPLIGIFNIMGRIPLIGSPFKEMATDLNSVMTKIPSEMPLGNIGMQGAANFKTFGGILPESDFTEKRPKNLAGNNNLKNKDIMSGQNGKGELTINIKDPGKMVESIDESNTGGIPVKTTKTGGNR